MPDNPWLEIPLADYEGHMESPEVQQLHVLAELFAQVLELRRPASVAILGVAGGNGLQHVDAVCTRRVVGLDLNSAYLAETNARFSDTCNLELHCVNLAEQPLAVDPVELVHAALVFEHAGVEQCFENAIGLVAGGGALSVVLQLPSTSTAQVGSSPFTSMAALKSLFAFVDPDWLGTQMVARGFREIRQFHRDVPGGKRLWIAVFERVVKH